MASKDSLRIADSLAHISKVCGYIARLLKVLLVAYCFCILLFYGAVAITYLAPGVLPFNTLPINLSFLALFLVSSLELLHCLCLSVLPKI